MRVQIPPPNIQPNPFRSGNSDNAAAGSTERLLNSAAAARAGALDAASTGSGLTTAPTAFDADKTAKNILDVIATQLMNAAANGASKEELGSLLQQAREGVQTGFDSAIAQLKDIGELDPALSSGIGAALSRVDQGFDRLAKQFGLGDGGGAAAVSGNPSLGELAGDYRRSFANGQSVDLTIRTADGDTVKLSIGADSARGADGAVRSSGGVTMSVDGNLDADETKALNDLVDRVGKLADTFFGGDMDAALQQADALQLGSAELDSMSLTLRRSVTTYQDVQSLGSDALSDYGASGVGAAGSTATGVKARLAGEISALLPDASFSANPAATLKELLAAQVAARDQQDNPLLAFANRLLDAMGAANAAAQPAAAGA